MTANLAKIAAKVDSLIEAVAREGEARAKTWRPSIERRDFTASADNLAAYLAVRRRDLRVLQRELAGLGLSSLGRMEGRVMPTLLAVRASLHALVGGEPVERPSERTFYAGERRLAAQASGILGKTRGEAAGLLVTCPSEAADDPDFMHDLAKRGVRAIRINCAHDDAEAWGRMIGHLRAAEAASGAEMKVFMDLAGPKIRAGDIRLPEKGKKIRHGELLAISRPSRLDDVACSERHFAVECTFAEAIDAARVGDRLFVDDGKLGAEIERVEPWGVLARVTSVEDKGLKLKSERAINFPDTSLDVDALTDADKNDLDFIAAHADAVEYSFVQSAADVRMLQDALAERRPDDWRRMSLILKIETGRAVANLPDIIVQAAARQPTAVMIARGDLSVEIGFARTAEMQEEILWLAEAASVPVIWATQVLEHLVKKGVPSRGEMTDAAMAARAECVMLNKGPYLLEAIDQLQTLLRRMDANQHKKAPMLRKLKSW